jgi:rSAM/selenodomain-associated transferase 2
MMNGKPHAPFRIAESPLQTVSIIIPTYNEAETIVETLERLRGLAGDFEVLVSDGASSDATCAHVEAFRQGFPQPLRLVTGQGPRGVQLNRAAALARGEILLFLHADAALDPQALRALARALEEPRIVGGNFDLAYEGSTFWSRLFTQVNRLRRRCGIYYGDSAVFVRRNVFAELGGFKPLPIMDDYEFVRRLEHAGRTACVAAVVSVSDRRWRMQGVLRTLLSWFWIQTLYSLGVPPQRLTRWYRPVRSECDSSRGVQESQATRESATQKQQV